MLNQMINGKVVQLTDSEEAEVHAGWVVAEALQAKRVASEAKSALLSKYGNDPFVALDKICQAMKIDYSTLGASNDVQPK